MIKQYIEFAIENGYEGIMEWDEYDEILLQSGNFMYLKHITSKEFIEAIARGTIDKTGTYMEQEYINMMKEEVEGITISQAIAIRDCKLEEFINNLLTK